MKTRKLLCAAVALMLVMGALTGCGGTQAPAGSAASAAPSAAAPASSDSKEAPTENIRIGVIMPSATHGFTGESIQHAEAEIKKLAEERGFEYKFLTAEEASGQVTHVETLLTWEPQAIVMWPIEGDALRSAAQSILDANIKLVIYDRLIEGFTPTAEIMGDNETIGKMTGEYFNKFFADDLAAGKKISYLEFMGDSSTVPKQRSDGFKSTINEAFVVANEPYSTGWQRQTAMEQMENWLNTSDAAKIEELRAIFTHDDEVVLGVLDALKNYSGPAKLSVKLLSGVGGRKENIATFADPGVEGLKQVTYMFSPSMIRNAVQMGVNAAYGEQYNGKDIGGLVLIDTVEIDESNLAEYEASDLFKERYSI
ncbi:substrate-binding domain-containing protein [Oscillospiraceae bacterium MB08-C2-2]|nr:substrate-binding domain-containing protein [Oscillospiraceae bacterium MB08-C2-2]